MKYICREKTKSLKFHLSMENFYIYWMYIQIKCIVKWVLLFFFFNFFFFFILIRNWIINGRKIVIERVKIMKTNWIDTKLKKFYSETDSNAKRERMKSFLVFVVAIISLCLTRTSLCIIICAAVLWFGFHLFSDFIWNFMIKCFIVLTFPKI